MKFTRTAPSAPSQQATRNRAFNCRMRNRHYEKSYYLFRKIESLVKSNPAMKEGEQLPQLREFAEILDNCLEYANAAIFYGKRKQISSYSQDRHWGILQEEVILVHFLEELLSSVRYIINRIETDHSLQAFAEELSAQTDHRLQGDGFVSRVIESLAALKETTSEEFARLYTNIGQRYEIGYPLFGILQELQHFR